MHGGGPSTHLGRFDGEGVAGTAEPRIEETPPAQVAWFDGGGVTSHVPPPSEACPYLQQHQVNIACKKNRENL